MVNFPRGLFQLQKMCFKWVWRQKANENMWIMTPMFCLLCYDSGRGAVLWSGPWLAAATSPGHCNGSEVEGRSQARMTSNSSTDPGLAPASALPLLLLGAWRALGLSRYCGNFNSSNWFLTGCIITNKRRNSRVSSLPSVRFQSPVTN